MREVALFELRHLSYQYPDSLAPALKDLNLRLKEGEITAVLGRSGSGKSTLLKALGGLIPSYYGGSISGQVFFRGRDMSRYQANNAVAAEIGILFQEAERQVVFEQVERDLAFGLENLNLSPMKMRLRMSEVLDLLGIPDLLKRSVHELSGGEMRKVALAGILAMHPRVLLLDEPVAQLDPAAGEELLQIIRYLNEEWGITVVIAEQEGDRIISWVDRVVFMDQGRLVGDGSPRELAAGLPGEFLPLLPQVPRLFRHWSKAGEDQEIPLTIKEGRQRLSGLGEEEEPAGWAGESIPVNPGGYAVELREVRYTYPARVEALKRVSLKMAPGEIVGIMGCNGAGKSTLLKVMSGLLPVKHGQVRVLNLAGQMVQAENLAGRVGYLSQNPNDYLWHDSVRDEIAFTPILLGRLDQNWLDQMVEILGLKNILEQNPRRLSWGERVKTALAAVLAARPELLLLDEPGRGLDAEQKANLAGWLRRLAGEGMTVVMVSHDSDFLAECVDRVIIMFDGQVVADGPKDMVWKETAYYAPHMARLFRDIDDRVVSFSQALNWLETRPGEGD